MENASPATSGGRRHTVGLIVGFGLFFIVLLMPLPGFFLEAAQRLAAEQGTSVQPNIIAHSMQSVAALALLMIALWLTEGVPLSVTGLLPLVVLPLLHLTGLMRGSAVPLTL